jgi:AAA domain (dynein-related subfamily)
VDPILRRLTACVTAHVPAYLEGGPGTGKTARVALLANLLGAHHERVLLSRLEPIDVRPRAIGPKGINVFDCPEIARAREAKRAVLFADELNRCEPSTANAALDLFDSAPPHVAIVAAGNPPLRGRSARPLESAVANRFCSLDVPPDADAWAAAQVVGWTPSDPLPTAHADQITAATDQAKILVSAFVRARPELLSAEPGDPILAGKPWPSPRTWDYAIRLLGVSNAFRLPADDISALLSGCVGPGPASELATFIDAADLPNPDAVLADPKSWVIPTGRADRVIAVLSGLAQAIARQPTEDRWRAAWAFVERVVNANQTGAASVGASLLIPVGKTGKLSMAGQHMPERLSQVLIGRR